MSNQVKISLEVVRLAQQRVTAMATPLKDELARIVVEETVAALDPEYGFLLGEDAFVLDDALVQALGVNDVVINDRHIDVRTITDGELVQINRFLVGTSYLKNGSLVVKLDSNAAGSIIGYISERQWLDLESNSKDHKQVTAPVTIEPKFNLAQCLEQTASKAEQVINPTTDPNSLELASLVANSVELSLNRQKEIVEQLLLKPQLKIELGKILALWSNGTLTRILRIQSTWLGRVEALVEKIKPRFANLKSGDIRTIVLRTGEIYGGQPDAPQFKRELLAKLTEEDLKQRFATSDLSRLSTFVSNVMSGKGITEAIQEIIKNQVVVDLAKAIKHKRAKVEGFMAATADEIGMAFAQLSLQPAYQTHSQDPQAGLESINEALKLLEAAEVAQKVKELEEDLA